MALMLCGIGVIIQGKPTHKPTRVPTPTADYVNLNPTRKPTSSDVEKTTKKPTAAPTDYVWYRPSKKPTRFPTSSFAAADKDTPTISTTTESATSVSYNHLYSLKSLLLNIFLPSFGALVFLFIVVYWFLYRHLPEDDDDALFRVKDSWQNQKALNSDETKPITRAYAKG